VNLRLPNVSEVWGANHPWGAVYAFAIDHPPVAIAGGRAFFGTDMRLLYRATEAIGAVPAGGAILDVPCGGGVALRGLRPGQDVRYVAADISGAMLERTAKAAAARGLSDVVETRRADVAAMPFADGEFDLCVTFTGLHCFPDPRAALAEIARVTRPGGEIHGSWMRNDAPPLLRPPALLGRLSGLVGPSASADEVERWLGEVGFGDVDLVRSGAMGYFSATRR
jgi:SAM-dependent methyltransferase